MSRSSGIVLNFPLPNPFYDIDPNYCAPPMAAQRSNSSANSNRSRSSAVSFRSQSSAQHHEHSRHMTSPYETRQHSSYDSSHAQILGSHHRRVPTSPSDKSDGENKEPQYCYHSDCLDPSGNPTRHFSRKADVNRHHNSTHDKKLIDCPWPKCSRRGDHGFTRTDHLNEHRRGYHLEDLPKRQNSNDARLQQGY